MCVWKIKIKKKPILTSETQHAFARQLWHSRLEYNKANWNQWPWNSWFWAIFQFAGNTVCFTRWYNTIRWKLKKKSFLTNCIMILVEPNRILDILKNFLMIWCVMCLTSNVEACYDLCEEKHSASNLDCADSITL